MPFSSSDPNDYLAIGKQSAAGTEATSFKFLRYLSGGITMAQESESIYEGGVGQDVGLVYKTKVKPDGEIGVFARPDTFTYLAAWALGNGAGGASDAIPTHIYFPATTAPPYLTIEEAFGAGTQKNRVTDAILSGFKLEMESTRPWRLTVPFIGGGTAYGGVPSLSSSLESGDPAFYAGGNYLVGDSATYTFDITKCTVDFSRKMDDDLYTVNTYRRAVVPLTRSCTVDFTLIYQNASVYQKFLYGGAAATMLPADLPTGTLQCRRLVGASQLVEINVPLLRYTTVELNKLQPDGETMLLNVSAQAFKGATHLLWARSQITGNPTSYLV